MPTHFSLAWCKKKQKHEIGGRDLGDAAKVRAKRRLKAWANLKMFQQIFVL